MNAIGVDRVTGLTRVIQRETVMRLTLAAAAATVLAASAILANAGYAQTTNRPARNNPAINNPATNNPAAARASLNDSYNNCVSLARARGYADSDLDGNRAGARNFVIRCMQGKQR
jgi:hypothetical protein